MHILMVVKSDLGHDVRVQREARTLLDAGHRVTVCASRSSRPVDERIEVVEVDPVGGADGRRRDRMPAPLRHTARWVLLPQHRARAEAGFARRAVAAGLNVEDVDVVHGHDLTGLVPAAALAARLRTPWIYDAHECWAGRRLVGRPDPVRRRRELAVERELGGQAAARITVSDGIAAWMRDQHGWGDVMVVRNTFPVTAAPDPRDAPPTGVVYAGLVKQRRDLEVFRDACRAAGGAWDGVVVGPVDPGFAAWDPGVLEMRPSVAPEDIDAMLRTVGIALVPLPDDCLNHRLALPNKLFHAVRAGVPVVAADLPEMAAVVRRHDLGELYTPGDVTSLGAAVRRVMDRHADLLRTVSTARAALSWEVDSRRLLDVYGSLPGA